MAGSIVAIVVLAVAVAALAAALVAARRSARAAAQELVEVRADLAAATERAAALTTAAAEQQEAATAAAAEEAEAHERALGALRAELRAEASAQVDSARAPVAELQAELDRTTAALVALQARLEHVGAGGLSGHPELARRLWDLEVARIDREWRVDAAPVHSPEPTLAPDDPDAVERAIGMEAARLLENAGVVIAVRTQLPEGLAPAAALVTVRLAQELLAAAAHEFAALELELTATEGAIDLVVAGEGDGDAADALRAATAVGDTVAALGGALEVDAADGRVAVRLRLPESALPPGTPPTGTPPTGTAPTGTGAG